MFVTQPSTNVGICLTNCVGYDVLLFMSDITQDIQRLAWEKLNFTYA